MERVELIQQTARYQALDKLEQYYESRQYANRPDWWTGKTASNGVAPLRERRPCVIYPLPKAATHQIVRFMVGVEAWPTLKIEDERVPDDQREDVAKIIGDLIKACKLRSAVRAVMCRALSARTGVAVFGMRGGRLQIDTPSAKDCIVEFEDNDPSRPVKSLIWIYQVTREVEDPKLGRFTSVRMWWRRDITADEVIDYEEAPVPVSSAIRVDWKVKTTTRHGLGFCPVLWLRNLGAATSGGSIDGVSIYEDQFDGFDALNFALSQRNRGVYFYGTPQPVETGVEEDDGPEAEGHQAAPVARGPAGFSGVGGEAPFGQSAQAARRMAPDYIWSYRSDKASVTLVETTGKWFDVTTKHVEDIRARVLEAIGVVLVNANALLVGQGRELSGRFLELAYAPMLAHIDELRDACWWDHIESMISMMMRVLATVDLTTSSVNIPRIADVQVLLRAFGATGAWMPPAMTPLWGPSFSLTAEETKAQVEAADAAKRAGLICRETAARFIAPAFGVQDVDGEIEEADEDAEEAEAAAPQASPNDPATPQGGSMDPMMTDGAPDAPMSDAESGATTED